MSECAFAASNLPAMKIIDIRGIPNMEPVRGGTDEWYWATDYIHGDLYEAEELFRDGHPVKSNRLYLIHYPDGAVYEPVPPVDGQYLGYPVYDGGTVALLAVNFAEQVIRILRFSQQQETAREIARLPLSEVKDCYNLILHTSPLSLTRQPNDGTFELIWPERASFALSSRESLSFRDGDKLYFNIWYEDPDYREEMLVRALPDGRILERFPGDIRIMPNGGEVARQMNNSMFVEATAADALTIIDLRRRIWDTTYRGIYPDSMIDDFDWAWHKEKELSRIHLSTYSVYLIRKDGRDIGYLTMHKADEIVLQSLYILSEYQRQGIGRIAFDFIKEYCKEQCAESFICQCVPDNLDARAFYERMGGEVIGEDLANEERWQNSITYRFSLTEESL